MPKITIENHSLHYQDIGQGPAILFGHSYLWDANMWREQVVELSKQYRCIVPDLWGHGDSDPLEEVGSVYTLADHYWQLMQALGIEQFSVVGLSVGGMWGTQLALDHPEAVNKLVVMDSYVGEEPVETQQRYLQMLAMVEQLGKIPEPMVEQLLPIFLSADTRENKPQLAAELAELLGGIPGANIPAVVALGRAIFSREDRLTKLPALKMPVLLMSGEFDLPRPVHEIQAMADLLPCSQCKVIPKAGHIAALEQPEAVNRQLMHFLA